MEGTHVTFACQRESHEARNLNYTTVCSQWGIWKPDPSSICYKGTGVAGLFMSCLHYSTYYKRLGTKL